MYPVVTLTTDFGNKDVYVASMKGVILSINRNVNIVDICHSIEPQNILQASFVFSTAYKYFPKGTIHVVIVDPGVGSERKSIILKTPSACFLAPDNGILSHALGDLFPCKAIKVGSNSDTITVDQLGNGVEAIAITNPTFWREEVSATFHGRDIFAPVGAHLSLGVPSNLFGEEVDYIRFLPIPRPYLNKSDKLVGNVMHIDNFGNIITNIREQDLKDQGVKIEIGSGFIEGVNRFYAEKSGLSAIIGSNGYLEISLTNGSAADVLKVNISDVLSITNE
jgi:S-adenosylmethionine hydrolase